MDVEAAVDGVPNKLVAGVVVLAGAVTLNAVLGALDPNAVVVAVVGAVAGAVVGAPKLKVDEAGVAAGVEAPKEDPKVLVDVGGAAGGDEKENAGAGAAGALDAAGEPNEKTMVYPIARYEVYFFLFC